MQNHIEMFKEEIMVLLLERKWIPTIMECYVKDKIKYKGYNKEKVSDEIKEIIANKFMWYWS